MWTVEKIISKGDYNYCIVRDHPSRTKNDYVLHHRVVMENMLGRLLTKDEVVHHINGDKKDNRECNLEIMSNSEHASHHGEYVTKSMSEWVCPWCSKVFTREIYECRYLTGKAGWCTCSKSCRSSLSSFVTRHGMNDLLKEKIERSFIREFKG